MENLLTRLADVAEKLAHVTGVLRAFIRFFARILVFVSGSDSPLPCFCLEQELARETKNIRLSRAVQEFEVSMGATAASTLMTGTVLSDSEISLESGNKDDKGKQVSEQERPSLSEIDYDKLALCWALDDASNGPGDCVTLPSLSCRVVNMVTGKRGEYCLFDVFCFVLLFICNDM